MQLSSIPCLRVHRPAARDRWAGGDGADAVSSGSVSKRAVPVLRAAVSAPVIKCKKKVIQDKKRPFFDNYT